MRINFLPDGDLYQMSLGSGFSKTNFFNYQKSKGLRFIRHDTLMYIKHPKKIVSHPYNLHALISLFILTLFPKTEYLI